MDGSDNSIAARPGSTEEKRRQKAPWRLLVAMETVARDRQKTSLSSTDNFIKDIHTLARTNISTRISTHAHTSATIYILQWLNFTLCFHSSGATSNHRHEGLNRNVKKNKLTKSRSKLITSRKSVILWVNHSYCWYFKNCLVFVRIITS